MLQRVERGGGTGGNSWLVQREPRGEHVRPDEPSVDDDDCAGHLRSLPRGVVEKASSSTSSPGATHTRSAESTDSNALVFVEP